MLLVQLREWMERADAFNEEGLFRIAGSESSLNRMMGLLATHNNNVDIIMRKSGAHVHEAATFIKVRSLSRSLHLRPAVALTRAACCAYSAGTNHCRASCSRPSRLSSWHTMATPSARTMLSCTSRPSSIC